MTRAGLRALLLGLIAPLPLASAALGQELPYDRAALIIVVPDMSFEEMMALPEAADLARAGGAGLLANEREFEIMVSGVPKGTPPGREHFLVFDRNSPTLGERIRETVSSFPADELLVLLLSQDSDGTIEAGDELTPIVMAIGEPGDLFPNEGPQGSLTSDSTRRPGVVIGADVRATDVAYLGVPTDEFGGQPIEIIDGPPPFELHERYLAQRRMYVPMGTAAALYVTGAGLVAIAFSVLRPRVPAGWCRVAGWTSLSAAMLATGLLAAGHLPELSYATAVPMVAIVTVFGTMAFSPLERLDLTLVPAGIGLAVLAYFVVEAVLGWSGMLTTLLGGSQLDGGRFYGLPNIAIGLLVGSALWVAQRLPTLGGFSLLCGLGLFAGLPFIGADFGGALTSFAAAGLWLAVRERQRLGVWKGVAVFAGVTAAGTALTLVAHAISPVQTHVTRFEERVAGIGGVLEEFVDRLQIGFDLIARSPAAAVPVLGLPVVLYVVLRPPASIRATFERWPAWRDALLVTTLAGIVGYVVNDSPSAAGLAFGLSLGGAVGVSLLASPDKMGGP